MNKNLAAILLVTVALIGLYFQVEFSGWVLFFGVMAVVSCDWEK